MAEIAGVSTNPSFNSPQPWLSSEVLTSAAPLGTAQMFRLQPRPTESVSLGRAWRFMFPGGSQCSGSLRVENVLFLYSRAETPAALSALSSVQSAPHHMLCYGSRERGPDFPGRKPSIQCQVPASSGRDVRSWPSFSCSSSEK